MDIKQAQSPANLPKVRVTDANRRAMNMSSLTLEVPEIPGYVLYWFADRPGRIARALQGGYEFVDEKEVNLNNFSLADDALKSGNSDMGSRVSVHGGSSAEGGAMRLYLMKIKKEWYDKDQLDQEDRNDQVAATIRGGNVGADKDAPGDTKLRYKRGAENLFTRKRRA